MKKFLILFIPLLFTGCLIPKEPPEEQVAITFINNCAWAMSIEVNYPNYNVPTYTYRIGEKPATIKFYKNIPVNIFIKGSYDSYSKYYYLKYGLGREETWTLEWSGYDNCYFIIRGKTKIRLN